jgi:murein L,D-transpeptidase YafK
MLRQTGWAVGISFLALAVATCVPRGRTPDLPTYDPNLYVAVSPAPSPTPALGWANGSEYALVIRKRERTLALYQWGEQKKVYPIVLGIASLGPKTYRGDLRTPEGVYHIAMKRIHQKWERFMLLSYPNDTDRARYVEALAEGRVPVIDGRPPGLGGEVGIHGTDRTEANVRGVDWTWGCISLLNEHIRELYDIVPIGTPVLIKE